MSAPLVVALDGPAGSGKSTVAAAVATRLGLEHLDTGAMYRAVTLAALRRGVPLSDDAAVEAVARDAEIDVWPGRITVDGVDGTDEIRARAVTDAVSAVAANAGVRRVLVERQRAWVAESGGGVLEGRDIGTVVFPDATLKAYVTASPRVRAERRVAQVGGDVREVEASILERDRLDSTRHHSPLSEADDAVVLDTSHLTVDEVVEHVVALVEARRS